MSTSTVSAYLRGHRASGLKVGDTVQVTRMPGLDEGGWAAGVNHIMPHLVGAVTTITGERAHGDHGFLLGRGWWWPHFVLRKVKAGTKGARVARPLTVVLTPSYTATITPTHVKVGCQMIPHAAVLKVVAAIRRVKARRKATKRRASS